MFHRPPKKYSEYLVNVPQSIDWILKSIWELNKGGGGGSGVSKIIAGDNITIDPVTGVGDVTINSSSGTVTVRTVDSYLATAGQTNFTITAATYDFVDVYLNGARLISSEYSVSTGVVTLVSAAELNDEIILISYYNTSIATLPQEYILRHDFVSPYSYCGRAVIGSLDDQPLWHITRIQVLDDGSTVNGVANDVKWTDRYTVIYT